MALGRARVSVRLAERVEVPLGAHAVARAAVAGIVDVKAVLASQRKTGNQRNHMHFVAHLVEARLARHIAARGGLQASGRAGSIGGGALGSPPRPRGPRRPPRLSLFLLSLHTPLWLFLVAAGLAFALPPPPASL